MASLSQRAPRVFVRSSVDVELFNTANERLNVSLSNKSALVNAATDSQYRPAPEKSPPLQQSESTTGSSATCEACHDGEPPVTRSNTDPYIGASASGLIRRRDSVSAMSPPSTSTGNYVWELKRLRTLGKGSFGTASLVEVVSPLPPWYPDDLLSVSAADCTATPSLNASCNTRMLDMEGGGPPRLGFTPAPNPSYSTTLGLDRTPPVGGFSAPGECNSLACTPMRFGYGGRRVKLVIKEINLSCCKAKERDALFREISILKTVRHPNVVRYIDSALNPDTNQLQILMEYCDGGDLAQLMDSANRRSTKGLTEPEIWALFIQLLMALKDLHFVHRVIHRDLKPQNIFLTSTGIVKVGDFGVSAVLSQSEDFVRTFCGSPYYLAPEICEQKSYNGKADLWSLGCVLYELLAHGERAFHGHTLVTLLDDIVNARFKPIDDIVVRLGVGETQSANADSAGYGPDLRRVVGLLLQKDPDRRASIQRLLRMTVVQVQAFNLLQTSLLRTEPYRETFKARPRSRRVGRHSAEKQMATGWNDGLDGCASPLLMHRRSANGRSPQSTVTSGMQQTTSSSCDMKTRVFAASGVESPSWCNATLTGPKPNVSQHLQSSAHQAAAAPPSRSIAINPIVPADADADADRNAVVFPTESPMIPIPGLEGTPSTDASPRAARGFASRVPESTSSSPAPMDLPPASCVTSGPVLVSHSRENSGKSLRSGESPAPSGGQGSLLTGLLSPLGLRPEQEFLERVNGKEQHAKPPLVQESPSEDSTDEIDSEDAAEIAEEDRLENMLYSTWKQDGLMCPANLKLDSSQAPSPTPSETSSQVSGCANSPQPATGVTLAV